MGEDYLKKLEALGDKSEETSVKAIQAGAGIVADQVRKNLETNLAGSEESTGALAASLGITPVSIDRDGMINAKIGFDGYDEKGVPNQLKARVMESGSSKVKKRPFIRPAVNATKKAAEEAMQKVIDEETEKIMKG
ncbi:MAG: hypothetical protein HDT20_03870 [Oscillibacter sp.]|nr:hypothetical protein [Oscillibacter sp.]